MTTLQRMGRRSGLEPLPVYGLPLIQGEAVNVLRREKQLAVVSALVEGNSVRSTERMTGVHRDTILRLLSRAGEGCRSLLDARIRQVPSRLIEVDEIWTFVAKKQKHVHIGDGDEVGDQWVFVALDADTKLIPSFEVGKRDALTMVRFLRDLHSRLRDRFQITTDGFEPYRVAVEAVFGSQVDFAQLIKIYQAERPGEARYSPPRIKEVHAYPVCGNPDPNLISTSYVERQNLTMRMQIRRFTRLTNAFSKRLYGLKSALALHFAHYNFVRVHSKHRVAPAVAAGLERYTWSLHDLFDAALERV